MKWLKSNFLACVYQPHLWLPFLQLLVLLWELWNPFEMGTRKAKKERSIALPHSSLSSVSSSARMGISMLPVQLPSKLPSILLLNPCPESLHPLTHWAQINLPPLSYFFWVFYHSDKKSAKSTNQFCWFIASLFCQKHFWDSVTTTAWTRSLLTSKLVDSLL